MLKIRDDVDLKELEKFGFRKHKRDDKGVCTSKWTRDWIEGDTIDGYPIDAGGWVFYSMIEVLEDKIIKIYPDINSKFYARQFDILFDLIKSDLIEKVEE